VQCPGEKNQSCEARINKTNSQSMTEKIGHVKNLYITLLILFNYENTSNGCADSYCGISEWLHSED